MPRGSREHVLYWTSQPAFLTDLLKLVRPVDCRISADSVWMPMGLLKSQEARLETFGPKAIPPTTVSGKEWKEFQRWWLGDGSRGNTPNWDIALGCHVEGRPGLILVEAKANEPELSKQGKRTPKKPSAGSSRNQVQIAAAIREAQLALAANLPGIKISSNEHYQLSNRIAFAWKLASMGVPTVLLYLGFINDEEIRDAGACFESTGHWERTFRSHLDEVCPAAVSGKRIDVGPASFWIVSGCHDVRPCPPAQQTA